MSPIFRYEAITQDGIKKRGVIDAVSKDVAISALQRRGLIVSSITEQDKPQGALNIKLDFFNRVSPKDVVILFQQINSLFEAQMSPLNIFRLLASETDNPALKKVLFEIASDIQSGLSISKAMSKYPKIFPPFYIAMIASGEESGRLKEVFEFLAKYIDRNYELTKKAINALIYPAFVIMTFIGVMTLMLTTVIPKLTAIIEESGLDVPLYTQIVIGISSFLSHNLILFIILAVGSSVFLYKYLQSENGKKTLSLFKFSIPYVGDLYKKLYLSRIADSLNTTLTSGIQLVRSINISKAVVREPIYVEALQEVEKDVKAGVPMSEAMKKYPQIFPNIFIAMIKVGEESGNLPQILGTIAKFYRREVYSAIETLVSLIEPIMIVLLGLGVGLLLASVLIPIYNISTGL